MRFRLLGETSEHGGLAAHWTWECLGVGDRSVPSDLSNRQPGGRSDWYRIRHCPWCSTVRNTNA